MTVEAKGGREGGREEDGSAHACLVLGVEGGG